MSFLFTVKKIKPFLVYVTRYAVLQSMYEAWNNCRSRGKVPEEPDFVASLVLKSTRIIENGWRNVFNLFDIQIAVTGIYCHQTPKVNFNGMKGSSCELGDLLWCHVHSDKNGNVSRNAILYQSKKSSKQPYVIPPGSDQIKLYTAWPAFTYTSSGTLLNNQKRQVKPAAPRRGAQFLLIDDRPPENPEAGVLGIPGTYPIGSCMPNNPLIDHSDLGLELVHSLEFLSGDPFDDKITALQEIGWSRVIWDILDSSADKAFRRYRSGYRNKPRISGAPPSDMDGLFYRTPDNKYTPKRSLFYDIFKKMSLPNMDIPPNDQQRGAWSDEGGDSVSVLLVETYESTE